VISILRISSAIVLVALLAGCATTSGVIVNPTASKVTYHSAYVVVHGDRSTDMDALLQKEMLRHGFAVSVGPEGGTSGNAQLIVRYDDDWKWDLAMYLRSFDVMVYDPKTQVLLATGSWKNSVFHGFYSEDKVVAQVVDQTLSRISAQ
jgi:hypothetical protein